MAAVVCAGMSMLPVRNRLSAPCLYTQSSPFGSPIAPAAPASQSGMPTPTRLSAPRAMRSRRRIQPSTRWFGGLADLHHGLGPGAGLLGQPGAQTARAVDDLHDPPPCGSGSRRTLPAG